MGYTFKRISEELYSDLIYISKSAFNMDPGINYYRNKNDTARFGEKHLGYVAYSDEGEPAAFYGVYAHPVIINGNRYVAAQSGDTMTHKAHTGKGLFTTLAKMTYDLAKEKGVEFIFGFPNYNSYPGFVKKLNWICPTHLKEFRSRIFTFPLAKVAKKISLFRSFYKYYANAILRFYPANKDAFASSVIEMNCGGVERTKEFINYKSFSGCKVISLDNVNIWLKIDGFLFIGDIERIESLNYEKLWRRIKRLCFILGIDTIIFQVGAGVYFDKVFSSFMESKEALPFGYLNLSGKLNPEDFKYVLGDVDTF